MQARSMLFTLFGDYIRYAGGEIGTGSLLRLMAELGFTDQAVRAALSRLSRQGWLTGRKAGNRSYYSLTPRALDRLEEAGRRIYQPDPPPWDGRWRMLTYTIPEAQRDVRDALRKELVWTGFGQLAGGVWISPCDLTERVLRLIDRYDLRDRVDLFTSAYHGPGSDADLVARCWDLPALRAHYDRFLAEYRPRARELTALAAGPGGLPDNRAFVERTRLVHEYRKFLFDDPGLPAELLPADWPRPAATRLFADLYRLLAPGADRFFLAELKAHGPQHTVEAPEIHVLPAHRELGALSHEPRPAL
jgi:phenylacetic acid degradation operon negative regulatory protein